MKYTISLFIFFFVFIGALAQNKKSKADNYFFQYSYAEAIRAYENDIAKGILLSPNQNLNLADSYFQAKNFEKASMMYLQYFSNDTIVDNFRLNRLLRAFSETSEKEKIKELLSAKGLNLNSELLENAEFNNDLLGEEGNISELDFQVFNLEANSVQSDFSPSFYNNELLFTSGRPIGKRIKYEPTGESYLDIFRGEILSDGQVGPPIPFNKLNNTKYHKATPYFSKKLNSVFYVLSNTLNGDLEYDDNGKNSLAIGLQKISGGFNFLWRDLSTSFYYPFFDANTDRLYFAADLKGGYGGTDIYFVNTNKGNIMSAPVNLGPRINSPGNEIAPFIFENSLYFSSDVFYGLGGMDIYKANISIDELGIPLNLGGSINSVGDDFGFVIKNYEDGLLGYFSSNRAGGKGGDDVYGFMVDEKPGVKTLVLKGKITSNKTRTAISKATLILKSKDGDVLKKMLSADDGAYRIEVPWQDEVMLEVTKEKYSSYKHNYDSIKLDEIQSQEINIDLVAYEDIVEEKEGQTVIKLKKFYFQRGQYSITNEISTELDKVVDAIQLFPQLQLRIETHTDSRGGGATNFRLTQRRSDAIKKYLLDNGVSNSNILYSVGYGEDKVLNNCTNGVYCIELLHKKNQRSLVVVLNNNILFD